MHAIIRQQVDNLWLLENLCHLNMMNNDTLIITIVNCRKLINDSTHAISIIVNLFGDINEMGEIFLNF